MSERGPPQSFPLTAGETMEIEWVADGDVTGAIVRFWAARDYGETPVLTTEGSTPNAVGVVESSPNFMVTAADEDTEDLIGTYVYEVELEDVFGNKTKAARGYLTFEKQVA